MNAEINVTNTKYSAENELLIYQHTGNINDLPDEVKATLTVEEAEEIENGEWVIFADGEVIYVGISFPFHLQVEDEKSPVGEISHIELDSDIYCPTCGAKLYNAGENTEDIGMNCPNGCGWIAAELQGEDLAVKVCPTTY